VAHRDVFGMITVRDVLDNRMRNIIFTCARSNCQTIDEEVILNMFLSYIVFSVRHRPVPREHHYFLNNLAVACAAPLSTTHRSYACYCDLYRPWEHRDRAQS
jgi:hypothetical protein